MPEDTYKLLAYEAARLRPLNTLSKSRATCPYCGGSTFACCEHAQDSVAELNKRVREGAD